MYCCKVAARLHVLHTPEEVVAAEADSDTNLISSIIIHLTCPHSGELFDAYESSGCHFGRTRELLQLVQQEQVGLERGRMSRGGSHSAH
jgi:hypothetical protein